MKSAMVPMIVMCVLNLPVGATPSITASGSWHDTVTSDGIINTTGSATMSAQNLPFPATFAQFDASTQVSLQVGDLFLNTYLGGDTSDPSAVVTSTYKLGATSATLKSYTDISADPDHPQLVLVSTLGLSWTGNLLTVTYNSTAGDAFGGESDSGYQSGHFSGTLSFDVSVGDGDYSTNLVFSGTNGVTSTDFGDLNNGSFSAQLDLVAPSVAITAPAAHFSTNDSVVTVTGTANDDLSINQVYWRMPVAGDTRALGYAGYSDWLQVDNINIGPAGKGATWATAFDMVSGGPGTNLIWVASVDTAGNASPIVARDFFYSVISSGSVAVNDSTKGSIIATNGTFRPGALEDGRGYIVTAQPKGSNIFINWTYGDGSLASLNPTISFIMDDSVALQANFDTNRFGAISGNYCGLFFDHDNGVTVSNAGYIALSVGVRGGLSGTLLFGSGKYSLTGALHFPSDPSDPSATAEFVIPLAKRTLIVDVTFAPGGDGALLRAPTGTVTISNATESIGSAIDFVETRYVANVAPAGLYNLELPPTDNSGQRGPWGFGYGSVTVRTNGQAGLVLNLPDSNVLPFSFGGGIAADGSFPFFAPLYGGGGLVMGWLNFTNEPLDDVRGENIVWIKPANAQNKFYPAGFNRNCEITGSRYTGKFTTNTFGWAYATLTCSNSTSISSANLSYNPLTATISVLPNTGFRSLSVTFNPSTGALSGTGVTSTGRGINFNAALLPKVNSAYGFFLGGTQSGSVDLRPTSLQTYSDGYVKRDVSGSGYITNDFSYTTTFWGYQNNSQYDTNRHAILMHKTIQVAPHLQVVITDAFPFPYDSFFGQYVIPLSAPYSGPFNGAGTLLGYIPQRLSTKFKSN